MGQLVLLVVAAAWAAVLVPPLLRSRIENRPNSSVSDFRDQLSSLQRAMPTRGVAMRARPLAPSPLSRPAAAGRPGTPGGRAHGGSAAGAAQPVPRRPEPVRLYDAAPRSRQHADSVPRPRAHGRDAVKRRRANVLYLLALLTASGLFLYATIKVTAMLVVGVVALMALLGYVFVLGQQRQRVLRRELAARDVPPASRPVGGRELTTGEVRRQSARRHIPRNTGQVRRQSAAGRTADRWSHAV